MDESLLHSLPWCHPPAPEEFYDFIRSHRLVGTGVGWVGHCPDHRGASGGRSACHLRHSPRPRCAQTRIWRTATVTCKRLARADCDGTVVANMTVAGQAATERWNAALESAVRPRAEPQHPTRCRRIGSQLRSSLPPYGTLIPGAHVVVRRGHAPPDGSDPLRHSSSVGSPPAHDNIEAIYKKPTVRRDTVEFTALLKELHRVVNEAISHRRLALTKLRVSHSTSVRSTSKAA